ncbi:MAG: hypothetical protein AAFO69_00805 [Bacteroidota bacterium]
MYQVSNLPIGVQESIESFDPPKEVETYENRGYWKDWLNSFSVGFFYHDDPTKIDGVFFLENDLALADGFYAYTYRVSDHKISMVKTEGAQTNKVPHSYLASGKSVYAAGMMTVKGGKIVRIDSSSGHYMPGPTTDLDPETCDEKTTGYGSLEVVAKEIASLGFDTSKMQMVPHRRPTLQQEQSECYDRRNAQQFY